MLSWKGLQQPANPYEYQTIVDKNCFGTRNRLKWDISLQEPQDPVVYYYEIIVYELESGIGILVKKDMNIETD